MHKRVTFRSVWLPYLLVLPQVAITLVFFIWPAGQALYQSVLREDAFGLKTEFVGLENFIYLFRSEQYLDVFLNTIIFSLATTFSAMAFALLLAVMADRVVKGASIYKTLLIWPYAVAPAIAGVLMWFLFNPTIGFAAWALSGVGVEWNHYTNGTQAFILVVIAAAWKQISYNFVFFLAGLQAIPRSLIEAAAIDGAGP